MHILYTINLYICHRFLYYLIACKSEKFGCSAVVIWIYHAIKRARKQDRIVYYTDTVQSKNRSLAFAFGNIEAATICQSGPALVVQFMRALRLFVSIENECQFNKSEFHMYFGCIRSDHNGCIYLTHVLSTQLPILYAYSVHDFGIKLFLMFLL